MKRFVSMVSVPMLGVILVATGCKEKAPAPASPEASAEQKAAMSLPPGLFVDEAPAGGRSVGDLVADPEAQGDVVIHGRIGGRKQPFVDGAAVFLLADAAMPTCRDRHGDACPTPWDYCCEPKDMLAKKVATIQLVDDAGKPLRTSLAGQRGLEPMVELTIAGDIAQRAGGTLVINARAIHVAKTGS